ncbi:PREDICTED: uncharacterized protein LOC106812265 [Priapulus caudatus]|uniref:Uncharacterized protein LOC106812265 n=1 Tax=Priapulus caudatus TaxID=37621 RepID=A0ABM1EID5_PRICU|nr:PREDICTED: uncharacterized protein LOC106812265 [Priapulus caudatus]
MPITKDLVSGLLSDWELDLQRRAKMGLEKKGRKPYNAKDEEWFDEDSLYTGVKLKVDKDGSIMCKRMEGSQKVIVKGIESPDKCSYSQSVYDMEGVLEVDKPAKIFDMKEFKRKVDDELSQPYHNKKKLQFLCFVSISFVVDTKTPLKTPCWLLILNISALDYLNDIMAVRKRHSSSHSGSLMDAKPYTRSVPDMSYRQSMELDRRRVAAPSPSNRDSIGESYTPPPSPPSPTPMSGSQYLEAPVNGMNGYSRQDRARHSIYDKPRSPHRSMMHIPMHMPYQEPIYVPTGYPSYGFPPFVGPRPEFRNVYRPEYMEPAEHYDMDEPSGHFSARPHSSAEVKRRGNGHQVFDLNGMDTLRSKMSERMRDDSETWHHNDRRDLESQLGTLPRNFGSPNRAHHLIMNGEVVGRSNGASGGTSSASGTLQRSSKKENGHHHPKSDIQADF